MECSEYASITRHIKADDGGDSVYLVLTDFKPSVGQVIITCCDECWQCWFGAMDGRTITEFVADAGTDYLENKLSGRKDNAKQRKVLTRAIGLVKDALVVSE